jgi:hypothetical protein
MSGLSSGGYLKYPKMLIWMGKGTR